MAPFDWSFPYASQRMPVLARNAVATSQPLAAEAGLEMLRKGGNAIDAAVATAMTLTVVEPTSNGIGSDAFALVWAGGGLHGLNASGRSPAALTRAHFDGMDEVPVRGWLGVTVPGAVSAWAELSRKFGALPFRELCQPAINYARHGFLVSPQTAYYWALGHRAYRDFEHWQETFAPSGKTPMVGDLFASPGHARSLEEIGESEGESFYRGGVAEAISEHSERTGGLLGSHDLAGHACEWMRPISIEYRDIRLHEIPPNGQGLAALIMLGMLRHFDVAGMAVDSADSLHVQMESMKLAFADAHRYIADPDFMDVDVDDLLEPSYFEQRAARIDMARAQDFKHGTPKPGGTVYLTTADADGNMVSYIQSNYTGFGSGIVVPETGIALQNRGACFSLEPGHPNEVGPSKRPYHTIIPGFVTRRDDRGQDRPVMSFGVMGGFMQPQGHAQVVVRLADYHQNPQAAIDAPRWRVDTALKVSLEPGFGEPVYAELRNRGHDLTVAAPPKEFYGRGQAIYRLDNGYFSASDGRADGQAVGF